jgi:hypothetical protein
MSMRDEASMSSSIWLLAAAAAVVMLAMISQLTDTATCYKIPGCVVFRQALGPGIGNIVD